METLTNARHRLQRLTRKFTSNPVLPMLGWTETLKVYLSGGDTSIWLIFSISVTLAWVFAEAVEEQAAEAIDEVTD